MNTQLAMDILSWVTEGTPGLTGGVAPLLARQNSNPPTLREVNGPPIRDDD